MNVDKMSINIVFSGLKIEVGAGAVLKYNKARYSKLYWTISNEAIDNNIKVKNEIYFFFKKYFGIKTNKLKYPTAQ
ncbi:hypothetical protein KL86DYS1_31424 [uncultured Dysgonomonas sp.]|uniref:Uncharacterized protein n=1 Tax=uncultured Dysgonomonas sp. TaxID=206096 RepID=A0A212K4I2_9BACT|nr:hypothetical protein KL86DYS1_31424 [uncultured Dysgonomonas sp.]